MNRDSKYSELPHWTVTEELDEEAKRRLEIKDRPKPEREI
jgi:hypothetical protein